MCTSRRLAPPVELASAGVAIRGATAPVVRRYSITVELTPLNGPGLPWWLTNVYGPSARADKPGFLSEIRDVRAASGAHGFCVVIST